MITIGSDQFIRAREQGGAKEQVIISDWRRRLRMHRPISIEFGWGQILNLMFDV